ncbi:GNAT family N-acetyltransferase [Kribbella sp. NPDC051620]|uniref:GNAT family N-acetyltransferase n=1 Tax=Kribbella sp. NPDC051620 TaxID=3364120 RepID=UPI00379EA838
MPEGTGPVASGRLPVGIRLERLRAEHADALLAFEVENRAYFAGFISDRGDAFFAEFGERLAVLLGYQAEGTDHPHVLVTESGEVVGRVNLVDVTDGSAELGYRIAEKAAGQGLATAAVREVCALAAGEYGLKELRAGTNLTNVASLKVLERTGFVPVGEREYGGRPGIEYVLALGV